MLVNTLQPTLLGSIVPGYGDCKTIRVTSIPIYVLLSCTIGAGFSQATAAGLLSGLSIIDLGFWAVIFGKAAGGWVGEEVCLMSLKPSQGWKSFT